MAGTPQTAAQRQFITVVAGIAGNWAMFSGGEVTSATTDVFNGGQLYPEKIAAPSIVGNITVTRPYDPNRDQAVLRKYRPLVGRFRTTVSVQPTDADLVVIGAPDIYANALLVRVNRPDVDASSGREATLALEFAVSNTT